MSVAICTDEIHTHTHTYETYKYMYVLKKLKRESPHDTWIPFLGIHLEKTLIQKDTCTPEFMEALFTIAKAIVLLWKQLLLSLSLSLSCSLSLSLSIHTHTHTHTPLMEYYSAFKKNEIMPFTVTQKDLETVRLNEMRQKEKDKNYVISLIREILNKWYKYTYLQKWNRLTDTRYKLMVNMGGERRKEWIRCLS